MSKHALTIFSAAILSGCLTRPASLTGGGETDGDSDGDGEATSSETAGTTGTTGTTMGSEMPTGAATDSSEETSTATNSPTAGETEGTDETTDGPSGCEVDAGAGADRLVSRAQLRNTILDVFGAEADYAFDELRSGVFSMGGQPADYPDAAAAIVAGLDFDTIAGCDADAACGREYVESLVPRLFRRAITPAEIAEFRGVFDGAGGSVAERISVAAQSILSDSRFFEIPQTGEPAAENAALIELDSYALASRLSYLFTNSTPDAELLEAAENDLLVQPDELAAQASRLLASPAAAGMIADYYEALLSTRDIADDFKDPSYIPPWDAALASSMQTEQALFVESLFFGPDANPTLEALLTSTHSFVNADLAALYGADVQGPSPGGAAFERVELDPDRRPGILSRTAFLSARAGAGTWDAPSRRAVVPMQALTCMVVPPPPPGATPVDVDNIEDWHDAMASPECAGCHTFVDPFGSALDTYDALGRWQDGMPADTLPLPDGDIEFADLRELVDGLVDSDTIASCAVQRHLEFAVRRPIGDADACMLEELGQGFADSGGDLGTLLLDIAAHPSFRVARLE